MSDKDQKASDAFKCLQTEEKEPDYKEALRYTAEKLVSLATDSANGYDIYEDLLELANEARNTLGLDEVSEDDGSLAEFFEDEY